MNSSQPTVQASCVAIDIGGTKVDVAIVHPNGTIASRERIEVAEYPATLADEIVKRVSSLNGIEQIERVGVACAGPMTRNGESVSPLNIAQWREFPLQSFLSTSLNKPVRIEGDVRALALAEGAFGAAQHDRNYASMVVSTGVGGALVMDGRLVDGDSGNAGHLGHINVVPNGNLCSCGTKGCLEAEASGWAIQALTGQPASEASEEVRERTARLVGRGIGTLASVLDFNRCYVAGSVALGFGDQFFTTASASARAMATMHYSKDLQVCKSGLDQNGSLLGAALVAWQE